MMDVGMTPKGVVVERDTRLCRVKICGLYRDDDIGYANALLPDYVGFILFVEKSHRNVGTEDVLEWHRQLDPRIQRVGVFVDPTVEQITSVASVLDVVQLHGEESAENLATLREELGKDYPHLHYWKAFTVKTTEDIEKAMDFPADLVLLDYGKGEGKSFDWSLLEGLSKPFILAGGVTPENVRDAVGKFLPLVADVSSGVETDKIKDFEKMKLLCEELRT